MKTLRVIILALLAASPLPATPVAFQSTAHQTSLVELYASEGCSSCPPAEVWFNQLQDNPGLWRDFVPVEFHVDYWNNLGWRDPWSKEDFSDRQRDYAKAWGSSSVYTPELVLNGTEWHRWFWQKQIPQNEVENSGVLKVSSDDGTNWQVTYTLSAASPRIKVYQLHTSLLVSGVSSDVTAGENSGHRLDHNFAALTLTEQPLVSKTSEFKGMFKLDEKLKPATGRLALAIWVSRPGQFEPEQVVGGWLPKP